MPLLNPNLLLSPLVLLGEGGGYSDGSILKTKQDEIIGGPARILVADLDVPFPTAINQIVELQGARLYDAVDGWEDLGATKNGVKIVSQHRNEGVLVDRFSGSIDRFSTGYELKVNTDLAQVNLTTLELVQGGKSLSSRAGAERLGVGKSYAAKFVRVAVLHQDASGRIRAYCLRKALLSPGEISLDYRRGEMQTVPISFTAFADTSEGSVKSLYGGIFTQAKPGTASGPTRPLIPVYETDVPLNPNAKRISQLDLAPGMIEGFSVYTGLQQRNSFKGGSFRVLLQDGNGAVLSQSEEVGFSNNLARHATFGNNGTGLCSWVNTNPKFGDTCLKVVTTNSNSSGGSTPSQPNPEMVGNKVTVSGYFRGEVGGEPLRMEISWRDAAGAQSGAAYVDTINYLSTEWERYSVTGIAPAGTHSATMKFHTSTGDNVFYVDGMQTEFGSKPTPWRDFTRAPEWVSANFPSPVLWPGGKAYVSVLGNGNRGALRMRAEKVDYSDVNIETNPSYGNYVSDGGNYVASGTCVMSLTNTDSLSGYSGMNAQQYNFTTNAPASFGTNYATEGSFEANPTAWGVYPSSGAPVTGSSVVFTRNTTDAATGAGTSSAELACTFGSNTAVGLNLYSNHLQCAPTPMYNTVQISGWIKLVSKSAGTVSAMLGYRAYNGSTYQFGVPANATYTNLVDGVWTPFSFTSPASAINNSSTDRIGVEVYFKNTVANSTAAVRVDGLQVKSVDAPVFCMAVGPNRVQSCAPGERVSIQATFRPVSGYAKDFALRARWINATGGYLSENEVPGTKVSYNPVATNWHTLSGVATAPAGAYGLTYGVVWQVPSSSTYSVKVGHRQITVNPSDTVANDIPTAVPDAPTFTWEGTTNASRSRTGYARVNWVRYPRTDSAAALSANGAVASQITDPTSPTGFAYQVSNLSSNDAFLYVPGHGYGGVSNTLNDISRLNCFPSPGEKWTLSGWWWNNSDAHSQMGASASRPSIWYSVNGSYVSVYGTTPQVANTWTPFAITITIPQDITSLFLRLYGSRTFPQVGNPITRYTGLKFERGVWPAGDYFDDSMPGVYLEKNTHVYYEAVPEVAKGFTDSNQAGLGTTTFQPQLPSTISIQPIYRD